jgi:hypothetical protein
MYLDTPRNTPLFDGETPLSATSVLRERNVRDSVYYAATLLATAGGVFASAEQANAQALMGPAIPVLSNIASSQVNRGAYALTGQVADDRGHMLATQTIRIEKGVHRLTEFVVVVDLVDASSLDLSYITSASCYVQNHEEFLNHGGFDSSTYLASCSASNVANSTAPSPKFWVEPTGENFVESFISEAGIPVQQTHDLFKFHFGFDAVIDASDGEKILAFSFDSKIRPNANDDVEYGVSWQGATTVPDEHGLPRAYGDVMETGGTPKLMSELQPGRGFYSFQSELVVEPVLGTHSIVNSDGGRKVQFNFTPASYGAQLLRSSGLSNNDWRPVLTISSDTTTYEEAVSSAPVGLFRLVP